MKNIPLINARQQLGISRRKVALALGISPPSLRNYELGIELPLDERKNKIWQFYTDKGYHITLDQLFPKIPSKESEIEFVELEKAKSIPEYAPETEFDYRERKKELFEEILPRISPYRRKLITSALRLCEQGCECNLSELARKLNYHSREAFHAVFTRTSYEIRRIEQNLEKRRLRGINV